MAVLLTRPPASWGTDGVLQPGDLGPDVDIFWAEVAGRGPAQRLERVALRGVAYHIMGANARTPQAFLDSMAPSGATLSEVSFFDASTSPTGRACALQVLPVQYIGAGTVKGCPSYITAETSPAVGQDADNYPWTEAQIELLARFYAFLVRNPRGWTRVSVPYQLASDPYASTAGSGGFGFHTFWGDLSTQLGGTSPWTLGGRSCPGLTRRGYVPSTPHYQLSMSKDLPGNVRALYNRIGTKLTPPPDPIGADMVLFKGDALPLTKPVPFPYKGDQGAVWMPVPHPAGYVFVHVDGGWWADCMNRGGEVKTIAQAALDNVPKMTAQDYRNWLAACATVTAGPPVDISNLATHADVAAVPAATVALIPPSGGGGGPLPNYLVELQGEVDLNTRKISLSGESAPVT